MTFKYFDKPEIFTDFRKNIATCDICAQKKYCFDAESFLGEEEITSICSECLVSGRLRNRDIFTCDGDIKEIKRQLKSINTLLPDAEVEIIANEKTLELEKTTPALITWQDWQWPCADGDYCRFIGYGSKPFYNLLAISESGEALFKNSFYYNLKDDSDIDDLWENVLPEKEIKDYNDSIHLATLFYVFKSLHSNKIVTLWDCI